MARIHSPEPDAKILGAGFLVTERQLLTCAHVVGARSVVAAVFVKDSGMVSRLANILYLGNPDRDDVAVLELRDDAPSGSIPVAIADPEAGDEFVAVGFPGPRPQGAPIRGVLKAAVMGGLYGIETMGSEQVQRGFSGTPAWCPKRRAALGMLVGKEEGSNTEAYIMPSLKLRQALARASMVSLSPQLATSLPGLIHICQSIFLSSKEIRDLYSLCCPRDWPSLPGIESASELLQEAIWSLSDAPHQSYSGALPLLCFVRALEDRSQGEARETLQGWREKVEMVTSYPPQCSVSLGVGPLPRSSGTYHLLISIETEKWVEDDAKDPRCTVNAHLLGTRQPGGIFHETSTLSAERRGESLYRILAKTAEILRDDGASTLETQIEFLLPIHLLGMEVDRWELKQVFEEPLPIGVRNVVVVRSLERDNDFSSRELLTRRWNAMKRDPDLRCLLFRGSNGELPVDPLPSAVCLTRDLAYQQRLSLRLENTGVVCAVLLESPSVKDQRVRALLQVGIPIALWPRKEVLSEEDLFSLFRSWIEGEPLNQLPRRVWEKRRSDYMKPDQIGHCLTLLWDDPTRPFPGREQQERFREAKSKTPGARVS